MAAEYDWPRVAVEAAMSLVSGITGLVVGVWRWGRDSVKAEQDLKDEFDTKIDLLAKEMRAAMSDLERTSESRLDLLVEQFRESFSGLRRQIDDDRLRTEQDFLRKDDFRNFREEYREDMRELKRSVAAIGKHEA